MSAFSDVDAFDVQTATLNVDGKSIPVFVARQALNTCPGNDCERVIAIYGVIAKVVYRFKIARVAGCEGEPHVSQGARS